MAKNKSSSKLKFDFQSLLLEKGEKIGLGIAAAAFVLLAFFGIMAAAGAANPSKLTSEIKSGIDSVDSRLRETPSIEPPPVEIPDKNSVFVKVKPTDFVTPHELFNTAGTISEKRNNPTILALKEGAARYQIGGIGVVMIQNDQAAVIQGREAPVQNKSGNILKLLGKDKNKGAAAPKAPDQLPPPGFAPNPAAIFGKSKGGPGPNAGKASEQEIVYLSVNSPEFEKAVLAVNLRPVRMARIQGIVPYKDQVAKYLRALRLNDDTALTAERSEPIYRGFNVERLILDAEGKKVIKDWSFFDHVEAIRNFQEPSPGTKLLFAAFEPIDPKFKDFIPDPVHMLFMKAPKLAHGNYSPVELGELGRALQELEKSGPPKDLTDRQKKAQGKDNPFDQTDFVSPNQVGTNSPQPAIKGGPPGGDRNMPNKMDARKGYPGPAAARTNAAPVWMLQFIDPTIESGYAYKYRIQLKAENPNYGKEDLVAFPGLAKQKELLSDWYEIEDIVYAMPEEYLYANGEKLKERPLYGTADYDTTSVKYHRWYDYVRVTRDGGISDPIGEWVIADLGAKRGQYIQEKEKYFRLPLWSMVSNAYAFRDPISKVGSAQNRMKGENVKMDFRPIVDVLLVDFDGGSGSYRIGKGESIKDDSAGEILIVTDDGKTLKVSSQNTITDKADPGRKTREEAWIKWLDEVRMGDRPANATTPAGKG